MNNSVKNFLVLLNNAIEHHPKKELIYPVDWKQVFLLAKEHNLQPLIFEKASEEKEFRELPQYEQIMMVAARRITGQARRTDSFLELYQAFLEHDLHPVVVKGIICRTLYGNYADDRVSGDEDLLIEAKDYRAVESVLKNNGYCAEFDDVTDAQLEKLNEISFQNSDKELMIDLHVNPMGRDYVLMEEMNDCFKDVFSNFRECDIRGINIRTMNHTDHYLFLVLHALKHFTGGGFGIRQVLDILLYQETFDKEIDWSHIHSKLESMNAVLFLGDLIHIGNKYLGFELKEYCEPNCPEEMLEDLMTSGVFGNGKQVQRTAAQMTKSTLGNQSGYRGIGKITTIVQTIFPSRASMIKHYPEIQEKPWRLYIEWVKRWGRFLKHNKENDGNLAKESLKISQRRIALLEKYKII